MAMNSVRNRNQSRSKAKSPLLRFVVDLLYKNSYCWMQYGRLSEQQLSLLLLCWWWDQSHQKLSTVFHGSAAARRQYSCVDCTTRALVCSALLTVDKEVTIIVMDRKDTMFTRPEGLLVYSCVKIYAINLPNEKKVDRTKLQKPSVA